MSHGGVAAAQDKLAVAVQVEFEAANFETRISHLKVQGLGHQELSSAMDRLHSITRAAPTWEVGRYTANARHAAAKISGDDDNPAAASAHISAASAANPPPPPPPPPPQLRVMALFMVSCRLNTFIDDSGHAPCNQSDTRE